MKGLLASVGTVAATLAFGAGIAHADESQYLSDLGGAVSARDGNNQTLINRGYDICTALRVGLTPSHVAGMIVADSDRGGPGAVTLDEARTMVGAAARDLC